MVPRRKYLQVMAGRHAILATNVAAPVVVSPGDSPSQHAITSPIASSCLCYLCSFSIETTSLRHSLLLRDFHRETHHSIVKDRQPLKPAAFHHCNITFRKSFILRLIYLFSSFQLFVSLFIFIEIYTIFIFSAIFFIKYMF